MPPLLATAILLQLAGPAAADTTPPAPVKGMVTSSDKSRIKLDWTNNTEADRAGYLVYRSSSTDGPFTKLTPSPVTGSEYADYAAPIGFPTYYRVTAVDTSANESTPVSVFATRKDGVKPAAPKSLTAKRTAEGVDLDWTDNTEADLAGYVVSRATSSGGTYTRLTPSPIALSAFVDTTAAASANSYYRVSAVDHSGYTSASSSVAALLPDTTAPAAVRNMVTTATTTGIKLDWASNSESDLAGYLVYRARSADGTFAKLTASPRTASDYTDTSAPVGVPSYYRVTAVDRSGNESLPVSTTATRKDGIAPAAPTALTAAGVPNGVALDWADNTETDLAGYVVSRATSSGSTYTRLTPSPITTSTFTDTTAPANATSYYRVTAVDVSGNTSPAASASSAPADLTAPAPVKGMTTSADTSRIKLDWTGNTETDLAGYLVYRSATADGQFAELTAAPVTASEYSDTAAPVGVTSFYRVTAVDRSRNESAPVSASAVRRDGTAPVTVTGLTAVGTPDDITLDWDDSPEADLVGYVVSRASSSGGTYTALTASPLTTSSFIDASAPTGMVSYYRVTAVDLSSNTSSAATVGATRLDTLAPATPAGLRATGGEARVSLAWTASPETDLAGYDIYRWIAGTDADAAQKLTAAPVTGTSHLDTTVVNGSSYTYALVAVDRSGNESPRSDAVTATVADITAPAAATGLTATGAADGVRLDWADNTETDLAGYRVYRAPAGTGEFSALTDALVAGSSHLDAIAPAGLSSYRVTAVDKTGNESPASGTADAAPADTTAPATPSTLRVTGSPAAVELDWADNTEADLAGYLVARSTSASGTFTRLTDSPITTSAFTDSTAPAGAVSQYRVTAVDTGGNESSSATGQGAPVVEKAPVAGADLTVAQDGSGDHTTVSAALAAAPANSVTPFVIGIKAGTYRELLTVTKPNVTLLGATGNASDVVLTFDNAAGTPKPDGAGVYGTSGSATMLISANNVTTRNLTIENSFDEAAVALSGGEQAVALKTIGDRLVFDNVRLLGDQDTLYADSPRAGALARSYYVNSYVEGDVDFIFGRGTAVFDRSTIQASTRGSSSNNGYVTAPSTDKSLTFGYLITDSTITSDAPAGTFHLGRPWQPSGDVNAIAQVVIRNTELPAAVKSAPWTDFGTSLWRNARLFEYANTGAGAVVNADRPQLSDLEATRYTKWTYLAGADGWNPTGQDAPPPPADTTAPETVAGLTAAPGDSSVALSWTASTTQDLAGYHVYRSTSDTVALTAANRLNAALLPSAAYTDRTAANGSTYRYVVTALDRAGNESAAGSPVTGTPVGAPLPAHDILVAADGTGQHTTVQAAINAATAGTAAKPTVIAVKPGTYREMITLSKNYVRIIGATGKASDVVLTYDNAAGTTMPGTTTTYGTGRSQSVLISGSNVTVKDLTIENSFDEAAVVLAAGEQAVALKTTGDRLVFDNVRLLGNQDTLLADSPNAFTVARSYFVNSYIEGDVDFIFGRGTAVFRNSTIHALSRGSSSNNGYITAASTSDQNRYGFLIVDSTITSNAPAGTFSLGRPWRGWTDGTQVLNGVHNSRGQVTIRSTVLPAAIRTTQPWADMSPNLWTDGRFFEHGNTGAGATVNTNRPQLTDEQASQYTAQAYLTGTDGWNPTA